MSGAPSITVTSQMIAKPGSEDAVAALLARLGAEAVKAEAGCLAYQVLRSAHAAGEFLVIERYADESALADHSNTAHVKATIPELMECLESPPVLALYHDSGPSPS
ncbi:MAG: putative quinol monooxygenase [Myxococcota bacterium]